MKCHPGWEEGDLIAREGKKEDRLLLRRFSVVSGPAKGRKVACSGAKSEFWGLHFVYLLAALDLCWGRWLLVALASLDADRGSRAGLKL